MRKSNPRGTDGSGMKGGDLLKGLKNNSPPGTDSSGMRTGHTINNESTRNSTPAQPPTLGPREA